MRRLLSPIAICLALGACAVNQPGTTPSAFDGTYQGTVTMANNQMNSPCATTGTADSKLQVQNGMVVWKNLYAPVRNDGAFAAQDGGTFFSGKITNRALVARVNASGCHQIYDLQKAA